MPGKVHPNKMTKKDLKREVKEARRKEEIKTQGYSGVHPCVGKCMPCGCAATACGCAAAACTGGCTAFGGRRRRRRKSRRKSKKRRKKTKKKRRRRRRRRTRR